jgi:hypothetical protein
MMGGRRREAVPAGPRRVVMLVAGALASLAVAAPAQALDNGLARTPPMGFNDWKRSAATSPSS